MDDNQTMCAEQQPEDIGTMHGRVHTCTRDHHRAGTPHECWCGERWLLGARVELSEGQR